MVYQKKMKPTALTPWVELGAWQMPDLLIFTGSDAAKAVAINDRLIITEIIVDFIIKQYHNEISTRG
jgi:hypothetical protein